MTVKPKLGPRAHLYGCLKSLKPRVMRIRGEGSKARAALSKAFGLLINAGSTNNKRYRKTGSACSEILGLLRVRVGDRRYDG